MSNEKQQEVLPSDAAEAGNGMAVPADAQARLDAVKRELEALSEQRAEIRKMEAPGVVSEIDRLRAENINLRLLNAVKDENLAQQALNNAQRALQEAAKRRAEVTTALEALRNELAARYNINFATHQVREHDGQIVPRPEAPGSNMASQFRG